jgi:hypothetical protein
VTFSAPAAATHLWGVQVNALIDELRRADLVVGFSHQRLITSPPRYTVLDLTQIPTSTCSRLQSILNTVSPWTP